MYTQCPDCNTAFRVTATVLKQAAGKVRCGGCGLAFNALDFLSEHMPAQSTTKQSAGPEPQLTPEPNRPGDSAAESVSAEQSAALLKTLDELAGSDIRIEDTGFEWRVLDDDENPQAEVDDDMDGIFDDAESVVDELLEESPTPVDQFLTKTPNDVESGEIFEESANGPAKTPVEELRFDDNTPLPDDFDLYDESPDVQETPENEQSATAVPAESGLRFELLDEVDLSSADIDLSEPDDWTDILGEVDELSQPAAASPDADLDAAGDTPDDVTEEHMADDEQLADADVDHDEGNKLLDMDTQFALQAEAMGIDLSGMHSAVAADELAVEADEMSGAPHEEPEVSDEEPLEQAELQLSEEAPDEATEFELSAASIEDQGPDVDDESGNSADLEVDAGPDKDSEQLVLVDADEDEPKLDYSSIQKELAELEEQSDVFDADFFDADDDGQADDDDAPDDVRVDLDEQADAEAASGVDEAVVPPLSEEEQTINRMIDQDLLSLAIEDEDGFTSTLVIPEEQADEQAVAATNPASELEDLSSGFETIIMEGENVHTLLDSAKFKADSAAAAELVDQAKAARDAEKAAMRASNQYRMIGGLVVLALLLIAQVLHQSRETLATIPAFNSVVGPVYRVIGKPLSPAWDVTGWQFEATQRSQDDDDNQLTIFSRIANKSDKPLPYPLISISLTDRFEETIGSRLLDPAEYLPNDLDPSKPVQPGNTFNAAIFIPSPAENASGFKLNVCYRLSNGQLSCHIPDFK